MKTFTSFSELELPAPLAAALVKMNFITPTPVQAASLPQALAGKDILGSAQTGTGKTGAFGIPLLAKLYANPGSRALILAPTRELAAQIHKVLKEMSHGSKLKGAIVVGGESFYRQKKEIKEGADYYVCTPGRLIDHIDAGLPLDKVSILVLDEVDRMLDMGFAPQLAQIVPHIPKVRQTLFFSATLPREIMAVASKYLNDPVKVSIGSTSEPIDRVKQETHNTTDLQKNDLLTKHLKDTKGRALVFARTQRRTEKVCELLIKRGFGVVGLHGGRTQNQRREALFAFRKGDAMIMVATDIAGRGIDVDDIECVINYDLPESREDYIHRIGRTARNGKTGIAMNYVTPRDHGGKSILLGPPPKRSKVAPEKLAEGGKPTAPSDLNSESPKLGNRPAFRRNDRGFGDRPPFRRAEGDRGAERPGRPPFRRAEGDRGPAFASGRPPFRRNEGDRGPSFGGGRPPFRRNEGAGGQFEGRPPFRRAEGDRGPSAEGRPPFRRPEGDRRTSFGGKAPIRRGAGGENRPDFKSDGRSPFHWPKGVPGQFRSKPRPEGEHAAYNRPPRPDGFTTFRSGPGGADRSGTEKGRFPRRDKKTGGIANRSATRAKEKELNN